MKRIDFSFLLSAFILPLCIKLSIFGVSDAQAQEIDFEHITDKDGLPNSTVTAILKDADGLMWFGTRNGLSRFDGYSFNHFVNDPNDPQSIENNYIRCLYESPNKILYVGFRFQGFCTFNKETETFTKFHHNEKDSTSLGDNYVLTIYGDKKSRIWIGTQSGLDLYDPVTSKFKHIYPFTKIGESNFISSITEDNQGNLWVYGIGNHICRFNPTNNTFDYIKYTDEHIANQVFIHGGVIMHDAKENLWIGNDVVGLTKYNITTNQSVRYNVKNKKLESDIILSLKEDALGNVWIGTDGGGLYQHTPGGNLYNYKMHADDPHSISGNAIYSIYESDPGVLWFGSYASGVSYWQPYKRKFSHYSHHGRAGRRLSSKSVLAIGKAQDGKIWIGTDGGGLNLLDPATEEFTYYTAQNSPLCGNVIKSLAIDSKNGVWCGTYEKGMCSIDFSTRTSSSYTKEVDKTESTILQNSIWSLCVASNDKIWIGMLTGGVSVFDRKTRKFDHDFIDSAKFRHMASGNVNVIFEDSKKRIWIGTEDLGVACFNPQNNEYIHFLCGTTSHQFPSNDVRDIFEDSRGTIWIGTNLGGLCKVTDLKRKQTTIYTRNQGLPDNNIKKILEDDNGDLWITTDRGLARMVTASGKFTNFDSGDGLQGNEFNTGAGIKTENGYLYFGGTKGLNFFHPDSIKFNNTPPPVIITDFKIFNHSLKPHHKYNGETYLQKSILKTNEITLFNRDYVFSIEFAALNFTAPLKSRYAYKLEGFNDQWSYVTADKRLATYTNLDPGTYIFRVKACNNDGVWNSKGAVLKIIVLPPWYKTWWFTLIVICIVCAAAIIYLLMREKAIRERNKSLEKQVRKRTAELNERNQDVILKSKALEKNNEDISRKTERILKQQDEILSQKEALEISNRTKDKFFSIIAHDLRNPVNALAYLIKQLNIDVDKEAVGYNHELITHIKNSTEKIQNLVLNLLEWAKTQSGNIKVDPTDVNLSILIRENISLLQDQAQLKNINFSTSLNSSLSMFADYNMCSTIVRNIISNGIKFTPDGGNITITATKTYNGHIKLSISDNGIGMPGSVKSKLFKMEQSFSTKGTNSETGTGLGMLISKEFAMLNKGWITVESEVNMGTTFHIHMPEKCEVLV